MVFVEKTLEQLTVELKIFTGIRKKVILPFNHDQIRLENSYLNDHSKNLGLKIVGESLEIQNILLSGISEYKHDNYRKFNLVRMISESLTNSFIYGQLCSINVEIKFGMNGELILIDQGKEFNYKELIDKFFKKEKYALRNGSGFKRYSENPAEVWYHNEGKLLSIALRG